MQHEVEAKLAGMRSLQHERAIARVNKLVDRCFDECVDDFGLTRQLRSQEETCLSACAQKFVALSAQVGHTFATVMTEPRT